MGKQRIKPNYRRRVMRLPDLDHCKLAVLNSLGSPASRRVYEYAIDQFIAWYCSEPRLAFNRIVVVRYRMHLESRGLAANTINQQLAAVRRLAHEAADSGLLSPELAAGISRVKGVKQLGFRSGNWLSAQQSSEVLKQAYGDSMRAKRDYAMLAMLFGCGFRRSELVGLELDEIQMRQGHWEVVDLIGKRRYFYRRRRLHGRLRIYLIRLHLLSEVKKIEQRIRSACAPISISSPCGPRCQASTR
jgi:site-specific recombinase XerD